jgi:hypothetical protein
MGVHPAPIRESEFRAEDRINHEFRKSAGSDAGPVFDEGRVPIRRVDRGHSRFGRPQFQESATIQVLLKRIDTPRTVKTQRDNS